MYISCSYHTCILHNRWYWIFCHSYNYWNQIYHNYHDYHMHHLQENLRVQFLNFLLNKAAVQKLLPARWWRDIFLHPFVNLGDLEAVRTYLADHQYFRSFWFIISSSSLILLYCKAINNNNNNKFFRLQISIHKHQN